MAENVDAPVAKETVVIDGVAHAIRTGINVGITEDGSLYWQFLGSEKNTVTLDGLVKYAQRNVDKAYEVQERRIEAEALERQAAAQQASKPSPVVEPSK